MNKLTFTQLKKNSKKTLERRVRYKLAVLGDCATQHLTTAIKGYAYEEGYGLEIFEADYNQIDIQVMDDQSQLYLFQPQSILIYMCIQKLYEDFCAMPSSQRTSFAEIMGEKIVNYWNSINQVTKVHILQFTFTYDNDNVFGNYALKTESSFSYQLIKLNHMLIEQALAFRNLFWIDLDMIQQKVGQSRFYDQRMYNIAKMPFTLEALPEVAKGVLDVVEALHGRLHKCVILDLDNTLWGGIIGDDGIENIQIGELGQGRAFTDFQRWLKELKNRGILLAVCSKNQEYIAKEPFISHPEMTLHLDDFVIFVANWQDKATNVQYIRDKLNIGIDSMVFVDDNPFERNLVRTAFPELTVPDLPEDPAQYVGYLKSLNLFETASFSDEDVGRTQQYRAEAKRETLKDTARSFQDYLKELEMTAWVKPFEKMYYSRIAQLTQRSNQFNLRTIRYTESEIEEIARNDDFLTLYFCLKDKFGDHGLIGVMILEKKSKEELFIQEWLMSCRVLKRGMEEFIINKVMEIAGEEGYQKVIGEYIPTRKNEMVKNLYSDFGFKCVGERTYEMSVKDYKLQKTYIEEKR